MTLNDWVEILGGITTAIVVVACAWMVISQFWDGDR